MQVTYMTIVQRDCPQLTSPPGCGCMTNSTGKALISLFDPSHDCAISATESNRTISGGGYAPARARDHGPGSSSSSRRLG
jgi:hypothetical protein